MKQFVKLAAIAALVLASQNSSAGVTLEQQFSVRKQKYGACHVYAANAAVQSACYRRTREVLPISEAYQFAHHLREKAIDPNSNSFLTIDFTSLFSNNDAGHYSTTIERILKGDVRLDSEFSMVDLDQALDRAVQTRSEFWKVPKLEQVGSRPAFELQMRSELQSDLESLISLKTSGLPLDSKLAACQPSTLRMKRVTATLETIVRLIDAAFPVICQFRDSPVGGSSHVYVLIGYRENEAFPNSLELFARNSNVPELVQYGQSPQCYDAAVVYGEEEESALEAALALH